MLTAELAWAQPALELESDWGARGDGMAHALHRPWHDARNLEAHGRIDLVALTASFRPFSMAMLTITPAPCPRAVGSTHAPHANEAAATGKAKQQPTLKEFRA